MSTNVWVVIWYSWARMSGVVIWCEHECPGLSFDVSTNVRDGHLMWARMSGPVKNRMGTNVRGNECPGFNLIVYTWVSPQQRFCTFELLFLFYIFKIAHFQNELFQYSISASWVRTARGESRFFPSRKFPSHYFWHLSCHLCNKKVSKKLQWFLLKTITTQS